MSRFRVAAVALTVVVAAAASLVASTLPASAVRPTAAQAASRPDSPGVSTTSCLAAGPGDTQLSKRGIVLRVANGTWTSVALPLDASGEVDLQGVSETSASSAVVVGDKADNYGFSRFTLVESKRRWAVKT